MNGIRILHHKHIRLLNRYQILPVPYSQDHIVFVLIAEKILAILLASERGKKYRQFPMYPVPVKYWDKSRYRTISINNHTNCRPRTRHPERCTIQLCHPLFLSNQDGIKPLDLLSHVIREVHRNGQSLILINMADAGILRIGHVDIFLS